MAKLAIKGHATRGEEVIKILEMLGGINEDNYTGDNVFVYYFINDNYIEWCHECIPESDFISFTLEEFLEKFLYKDGDRVSSKYLKNYKIEKMEWEDTNNKVIYKLQGMGWYSADELQPYKEETMEDNIIDTVKESDNRYRIVLNHQFDMEVDEGEYYAVRRKPQYPKNYEDCCKVLNIIPNNKLVFSNPNEENEYAYRNLSLYNDLDKLKICRDAYWKIAGNWEPNWEDNTYKYVISNNKNHIVVDFRWNSNTKLSFPTEEMRDAFYTNFKKLIEECKELL